MTPDFEPAPIQFSVLLNITLWTGDVIPDILCSEKSSKVQRSEIYTCHVNHFAKWDTRCGLAYRPCYGDRERTMRQFGWPTIHRLIRLSSPPVASVRPLVGLSARQFTLEVCAKNSPKWREYCRDLILINAHRSSVLHSICISKWSGLFAGEKWTYTISSYSFLQLCSFSDLNLVQSAQQRSLHHDFKFTAPSLN